MKQLLFGVLCILSFGFLGVTATAFASTNVAGIIATDTLWTASSSPYIATDKITVPIGVTLTLEKGVVVKLRTKGIQVDGSLKVEGTETQPVYFTAQTDDTVGGDSNGDGSTTAPTSASWQGIQFGVGSAGSFSHTVFRYAGHSSAGIAGTRLISTVHNLGGVVDINNAEFAYSPSCAIGQTAGTVTLSHVSIHDISCGVVSLGGSLTLNDNTIKSSNTGFFSNGAHTVTLRNNVFEGAVTTADINLTPVTSFVSEGNSASGGQLNGLIIRGVLASNLRLTKDSMPYIISGSGGSRGLGGFSALTSGNLTVGSGSQLSIEAGTILKFNDTARLIVDGKLLTAGTENNKIYATSLKDDTQGGDTNGDGSTTAPTRGDWNQIQFNSGSRGELAGIILRYGGRTLSNASAGSLANLYNNGGDVSLTSSELAFGGTYGVRHNAGTTTILKSFIHDNPQYGVINTSPSNTNKVNAQNNYWNHPTGPKHSTNPLGLGDRVSDKVLFTPWKTTNCFVNCHSSVLFLPGIQASRLYKDTLLGEDQVWPPNAFNNNDVQNLSMTAEGASVNSVYTRDVIDTSIGVGDVYGGFIRFLNKLKTEDLISDWKSFAYDWRYSVTDTAQNGTQYEDGIRYAANEIEQLALTSRTGKVTVIGHSNGGLLAKAIMRELERRGKSGLIDKVVFVASPQLGTPKAIGTILHGYDQTDKIGGVIINAQNAREVINNLPGAYGLLPSARYFEGLTEPIVTFANGGVTTPYQSVYGNTITSYANYVSFVRGADSLPRDIDGKVSTPARANSAMLNEGLAMHDTELDTWVAPSGVEVIEIVGTGLPTMKAVEYREIVEDVCGITCAKVATLKPYAVLTHYGDETVVQRSAEGYGGAKKKYFFNIKVFNDFIKAQGGAPVFHYNITEAPPLQTLVKELLQSTTTKTNQFISTSHTEFLDQYDVEIIDSPVRLISTDTQGNETGVVVVDGVRKIKEDIPGSQYFEFGDTKYFVVPKGTNRTTKLYGEDYGGYSLTTAELMSSDTQVVKTELKNASTTPTMVASYSNTGGQYSTVVTDLDGDGTADRETTIDGVVIEDEIEVTYATVLEKVRLLKLADKHLNALVKLITQAEKHSLNDKSTHGTLQSEMQNLINASRLVELYIKKRYISASEGLELLEMIEILKDKQ